MLLALDCSYLRASRLAHDPVPVEFVTAFPMMDSPWSMVVCRLSMWQSVPEYGKPDNRAQFEI